MKCPSCGHHWATKSSLPPQVAALLQGAATRTGRSDRDLADAAGIRPDYLRLLLAGRRRPSGVVAAALIEALDLSRDEAALLYAHAALGAGRDRQIRTAIA